MYLFIYDDSALAHDTALSTHTKQAMCLGRERRTLTHAGRPLVVRAANLYVSVLPPSLQLIALKMFEKESLN
jgi:hypothetical protein